MKTLNTNTLKTNLSNDEHYKKYYLTNEAAEIIRKSIIKAKKHKIKNQEYTIDQNIIRWSRKNQILKIVNYLILCIDDPNICPENMTEAAELFEWRVNMLD